MKTLTNNLTCNVTILMIYIVSISLLSSCTKKNTTIKVKYQMVDTSFGLASYNVYCSDTSWEDMQRFGDSLKNIYPSKVYTVVAFIYPEHTVPAYKEHSYAIKSVSPDEFFIIGKYNYLDSTKNTYVEKIPQEFIRAKKHERENK